MKTPPLATQPSSRGGAQPAQTVLTPAQAALEHQLRAREQQVHAFPPEVHLLYLLTLHIPFEALERAVAARLEQRKIVK